MIPLNNPPSQAKFSIPLTIQPQVLLLDIHGKPVAGKQIEAITWLQNMYIPTQSTNANKNYNRYAVLIGATSEPSNADGIAAFSNLTIMGSTDLLVFINFVCDNDITITWNTDDSIAQYPRDPMAIDIMDSDYNSVIVIKTPPTEVFEGEKFSLTAQIKNSQSLPVNNKSGILVLKSFCGQYFPMGFQQWCRTPKHIVRPVAAYYTDNFEDVLTNGNITYKFTGSDGVLEFSDVSFMLAGDIPSGKCMAQFSVFIGVTESASINMTVKTTVGAVNFYGPFSEIMYQAIRYKYDTQLQFRVMDKQGYPIIGKYIEEDVSIVDEITLQPINTIQINIYNMAGYFIISDKMGSITVCLDFKMLPVITSGRIRIFIDGVTAYSPVVKIMPDTVSSTSPAFIFTTNNYNAKNGEEFNITYQKYNYRGVLDNGTIPDDPHFTLMRYFGSQYFLTTIVSFIFSPTVYNGSIWSSKVVVYDAPYGQYLIKMYPRPMDDDYSFNDFSPIRITISDQVAYANLIECPFSYYDYSDQMDMNRDYSFKILLLDNNRMPLSNYKAINVVQLIHTPPQFYAEFSSYLGGSLRYAAEELFTTTRNLVSDSNGFITATLRINSNYVGYYILAFQVNGVYTHTFRFKTEFPPYKLEFVQQPDISYSPFPVTTELSTQPKIKLIDLNANPLKGYKVSAIVENLTVSSYGCIDVFCKNTDSSSVDNAYLGVIDESYAFTDDDGIASFTSLYLLDVSEPNTCINFVFSVGEGKRNIKIMSSKTLCFSNFNIYTLNHAYDHNIAYWSLPTEQKKNIRIQIQRQQGYGEIYVNSIFVVQAGISTLNNVALASDNYGGKKAIVNNYNYMNDYLANCNCISYWSTEKDINTYNCIITDMMWVLSDSDDRFNLVLKFPFSNGVDSDKATTATILVQSKPNNFYIDEGYFTVPESIYVGEMSTYLVMAVSRSLNFITFSNVYFGAVSVKESNALYTNSILQVVAKMNSLTGKAESSISVQLDKNCTSGYSAYDGWIQEVVIIEKGKPGKYTYLVQLGTEKSLTSVFELKNHISIVKFNATTSQTIYGTFETFHEFTLGTDPVIKVFNESGNLYGGLAKKIEVKLLGYDDVQCTKVILNRELKNISYLEVQKCREDTSNSLMYEIILLLFALFGKESLLTTNLISPLVNISYSQPIEIEEGVYKLPNISFNSTTPSKYYIVVDVLGIETEISEVIEVKKIMGLKSIMTIFRDVFILVLSIMLIAANIRKMSIVFMYFSLGLAISLSFFTYYLGLLISTITWVILALLTVLIIYSLVSYHKKPKHTDVDPIEERKQRDYIVNYIKSFYLYKSEVNNNAKSKEAESPVVKKEDTVLSTNRFMENEKKEIRGGGGSDDKLPCNTNEEIMKKNDDLADIRERKTIFKPMSEVLFTQSRSPLNFKNLRTTIFKTGANLSVKHAFEKHYFDAQVKLNLKDRLRKLMSALIPGIKNKEKMYRFFFPQRIIAAVIISILIFIYVAYLIGTYVLSLLNQYWNY